MGLRDRLKDEVSFAVRCGSLRAEDAAWVRSFGGGSANGCSVGQVWGITQSGIYKKAFANGLAAE